MCRRVLDESAAEENRDEVHFGGSLARIDNERVLELGNCIFLAVHVQEQHAAVYVAVGIIGSKFSRSEKGAIRVGDLIASGERVRQVEMRSVVVGLYSNSFAIRDDRVCVFVLVRVIIA